MKNYCAPNYEGFMCSICREKTSEGVAYQRSFDGECIDCFTPGGLMILYIVFWGVFILILILLSNMLTKRVEGNDKDHKIIFRIWINYLQVYIKSNIILK
jgi:hypothetical protein